MEKREIKKRFEAKGLSVKIELKGEIEEETVHLYNILCREISRFMQEEVMDRRAKELLSKLNKE